MSSEVNISEENVKQVALNCGEALIDLLEQYGVDTVFGIPGVHTLDLYRGLTKSNIRHVLPRNEAGAGFMADGYARITGKPGVCIVITGPGVTNITTPMGQAFADSIPMLVISSSNERNSLGKGWGQLHEITDQQMVTTPLTALSATALSAEDIPALIGQAFSIFASSRPRPVHISIPIDLLSEPANAAWQMIPAGVRAVPDEAMIEQACDMLVRSLKPLIIVGGGAIEAGADLIKVAELLQAPVVTTNAGKGVVPSSHPLSLGGTLSRQATLDLIAESDVVLAIGSELARTDSYTQRLPIKDKLIRIDIDATKINDKYHATIGVVADAAASAAMMVAKLENVVRPNRHEEAAAVRANSFAPLDDLEKQHIAVLNAIRAALPEDGVLIADMTQVGYTGTFHFTTNQPRTWLHPGGFCTLGCAMPMAVGAKIAAPERAIVAMAGDGGFMFTMQELMVAIEEWQGLPIVIWDNSAYGQIKQDMMALDIPSLGVDLNSLNYVLLAHAFGCHYEGPTSLLGLTRAVQGAFSADAPTIIEVRQDSSFLLDTSAEPMN